MRALKWSLPLDDQWHPIGSGPVLLVGPHDTTTALVWTLEPNPDQPHLQAWSRYAKVYGTGHLVDDQAEHLGSYQAAPFVWHIFGQWDKPQPDPLTPSPQGHTGHPAAQQEGYPETHQETGQPSGREVVKTWSDRDTRRSW